MGLQRLVAAASRTRAESSIDIYEILLFFHVLGAIVWIGLGLTGQALTVWAYRSREWVFAGKTVSFFEWLDAPAGVLGPLLLLGTGIGLVLDGPWSFGDTWILVGLIGYGAALGLGIAFQGPGGRRMSVIVRERGVDDGEALALGLRLSAFMWLELAILVVVLLAMTVKPTGAGSAAFWATVAALLAGSWVLAARDFRAARTVGVEPGSSEPPPAE